MKKIIRIRYKSNPEKIEDIVLIERLEDFEIMVEPFDVYLVTLRGDVLGRKVHTSFVGAFTSYERAKKIAEADPGFYITKIEVDANADA